MKSIKLSVFILATLLMTNSTMPITLKTMNAKQIQELSSILETDNAGLLKDFISNNPNLNWNKNYKNLSRGNIGLTPLNAAAWLGAAKCVQYLFIPNNASILASINTQSDSGYSPLHYATNPPRIKTFPNQNAANYTAIISTLHSHGAKNLAPKPTIKRTPLAKKA